MANVTLDAFLAGVAHLGTVHTGDGSFEHALRWTSRAKYGWNLVRTGANYARFVSDTATASTKPNATASASPGRCVSTNK